MDTMLSRNVWIKTTVKMLLTGLIFITAVSLVLQGAMRLKSAKEAGVKHLTPADNPASLSKSGGLIQS